MNSNELSVFQQMSDGIVLLGRDFVVEYANPSFLSLIQASSLEEISAFEFYEFAATIQDKTLIREFQTISLLEVTLSTMNKEKIPVELSFSPRVDRLGVVQGYIVAVRDISLRRNDWNRLQQRMEKYKRIAFSGFDWLWEIDSAATYTFVSSSVYDVMGYSPEELFGKTPFDMMTREEGERTASAFNRFASRNESFTNLENHCLTKSGDEIILATSGVPVLDEDGKLKGYCGGDRDITNEVRNTGAMKNSLAAIRQILESLPVGVVITDRNKRIRQVNDRACTVIGRKREELIGDICHTAFCPALVDQCPIIDLARKIDRAEHFILHRDGHKIPVVKTAIPIQLDSEDLLLEVFIDVSEIKSLEEDLNEKNRVLSQEIGNLKEKTQRADARSKKSRKRHGKYFSDKIAALGGIIGMVDLLLETEQTEEQKSMLTTVKADCGKLTNAVHLMQGKMGDFQEFSLENNEFLLRKLLNTLIASFRDRCSCIDVQIDPMLPDLFFGPARGIESVLRVLLDYSMSRLSGGAVEAGVTCVSSNERTMEIRFSVKLSGAEFFPEGVGQFFKNEDLPALDRRFATCREFALATGGEFYGKDIPDTGSAFWLTIPLERRVPGKMTPEITLEDVHVLVMENDRQLRGVYLKMLESMGCRVLAVADRAAALVGFKKAAESGDPIQIAILDGDSSENDGLIMAKLIMRSSVTGDRTDLIMCSSQIKPGDIDSFQAEGYSALLHKPLNLSTLKDCLLKLAGGSGEKSPIITEYSLP